ncbi:MAG: site-specific integrase [Desulfobacterales bacterium]|nr:site-specific integrase [Desulfobacterales bacterium]
MKKPEVKRLLFYCETLRERIIIRLLVHCGLRREEAASLMVGKIDWGRGRISFIGKGRLAGIVPVPPDLLQDIKFFLAGRTGGYLFPAKKVKNTSLTITQINRIVTAIGKRAGIKSPNPKSKTGNINPHLLRHTFARMCKDSGLTIEDVQGLMRHASFKTTYDVYGTLDFDEIQKRYQEKFLGIEQSISD